MEVTYRKAVKDDADLLIEIYNSSFYDDYVFYGEWKNLYKRPQYPYCG